MPLRKVPNPINLHHDILVDGVVVVVRRARSSSDLLHDPAARSMVSVHVDNARVHHLDKELSGREEIGKHVRDGVNAGGGQWEWLSERPQGRGALTIGNPEVGEGLVVRGVAGVGEARNEVADGELGSNGLERHVDVYIWKRKFSRWERVKIKLFLVFDVI